MIIKILCYLWAAPVSCLGLMIGLVGLLSGGRGQWVAGVLEFHGGAVGWLLARWPFRAQAMTLGHVVLGRDAACLQRTRRHERVHVHQAEIWGPLFLPAYALASLWAWWRYRQPYWDNWFERQARQRAGEEKVEG